MGSAFRRVEGWGGERRGDRVRLYKLKCLHVCMRIREGEGKQKWEKVRLETWHQGPLCTLHGCTMQDP